MVGADGVGDRVVAVGVAVGLPVGEGVCGVGVGLYPPVAVWVALRDAVGPVWVTVWDRARVGPGPVGVRMGVRLAESVPDRDGRKGSLAISPFKTSGAVLPRMNCCSSAP